MAATRDDVARRAGVSVAVVSYVVNNGPRPVATETRRRVLDAIEELGYRPDAVARHLRTGKSGAIGVVLPDLGLPHFGEMTQVLSELAAERGQQMIIGSTGWDSSAERRQLEFLAAHRVVGILLMSVEPLDDFEWLATLGSSVVIIDRPEATIRGAETATGHLVEHGRNRIGFVGGPAKLLANKRRREGWAAALATHGLDIADELMVAADISQAGGYEAAQQLLLSPRPPTGVYIDSDAQAVGFLRAAADLGVSVPEDVAVVSGEGTSLAAYSVPSLTTVEIPRREIACEALDALAEESNTHVRRVSNSDFRLVPRQSCGCHGS
jgi:LacI family transcriptional regulator